MVPGDFGAVWRYCRSHCRGHRSRKVSRGTQHPGSLKGRNPPPHPKQNVKSSNQRDIARALSVCTRKTGRPALDLDAQE